MNTNHDQVEDLLNQALEFKAEQRAAFLAGACGADKFLREKVETLLKAHGEADGFLSEAPTALNAPLSEGPGTQIDKYKLLEKLGEGGFGVVYMAEQREPVKRRVALKIIKIGMDTREVVARFEAERQALAMMDHPNIAKILDAGMTGSVVAQASPPASSGGVSPPGPTPGETPGQPAGVDACATLSAGRPYFVMELVRGIKITDYCDEKKLSTRERLDLFTKVCQAVQHAHQKGIIHRDLKPSNILVTVNDGVAVPKVIDFGIAKATQADLTKKTVFTRFHQFLGTPAYMSPEQAEMTSLDIDTRSDIYALGVLLYELLTGKTPFDANELLKAGLVEMRRTIREEEPERPSTRVSTLRGEELTTTAKRRGLDAPKLINVLRGDLDWIVMKCLEKDRGRRYEAANSLASDVQRHLNHEPVAACSPSNLYKFQKLVRRNKLAFAAGAGIAAALVLGLAIALWQSIEKTRAYNRAVAAEKAAQTEAVKSRQVAQALEHMLAGAGPKVAKGRDATILLEILDEWSERISKELTNQPEVELDLQIAIANVYRELGQPTKAEKAFREALRLKEHLGDPDCEVAKIRGNLAAVLLNQGKLADAGATYREALRLLKTLCGENDPNVAVPLLGLGMVLEQEGKLEEAEAMMRQALETQRRLLGGEHPDIATSLNNLAGVLLGQNKLAAAEAMYRESLAMMHQKLLGGEHPETAISLHNLAAVLERQNKFAEAETIYRKALDMLKQSLGKEHPRVARTLLRLGSVLEKQGQLQQAETLIREALEMIRKLLGNEHPDVAVALDSLAGVLESKGKFQEAEPLRREALAIREKLFGSEHLQVTQMLNNLAVTLMQQGKSAEAEALFQKALTMRRKLLGKDDASVAALLGNLADVLNKQRKFSEAKLLASESLKLSKQLLGEDDPLVATILINMGNALVEQRELPEAERCIRDALAIQRKRSGKDDPNIGTTLNNLGGTLYRQGKLTEAEPFLHEAVDLYRRNPDWPIDFQSPAFDFLGKVLAEQGNLSKAETVQFEHLSMLHGRAPDNDRIAAATAELAATLIAEKKFTDAEPIARECLEFREKRWPDRWGAFSARLLVGESLLGQKKYTDAEPLLLAGYEGTEQW